MRERRCGKPVAVTWTARRCAGTWQMGDVYQVSELCEELIEEIVTESERTG